MAKEGMHSFGFPQTNALLPPDEPQDASETLETANADMEIPILHQLTHMLGENVDLNKMVMAVLERVYRAVEMETVVFALVDGRSNIVCPKFRLRPQRDEVMSHQQFAASDGAFLEYLLNLTTPAWHKPGVKSYKGMPDPLISMLDGQEYFISAINLGDRLSGATCASRRGNKSL